MSFVIISTHLTLLYVRQRPVNLIFSKCCSLTEVVSTRKN